jgi:nucleoside-diphosphate-sugar epimerase
MILVTGGTGLVGAHLLYKLVSDNETVRAIYRTERKLENVKKVFSCYTQAYQELFNKIEWVKADILDIPALDDALTNVIYVYHCAAFVSFEPDKYQLLRHTNIDGTANVVNLCITNAVKKLCYVSSIATVGNPLKNEAITEETHWNPEADNSVYAITKYGAEMEVWRGTQEGLDAVIINPGVILGAGIWRYGSGVLFKKIHKGITYYTSGSIALVSVKDVTAIMVQLLKSDIKNERYILVAENWSYKSFLQTTANALQVKPPKKLAKPWLLQIGWRLDWLKRRLTGKRRRLTKQLAQSLITKKNYSNTKITATLNYNFEAVEDVIAEVATNYLKQHQ